MSVFSSRRERRLWIWTLAVVIAIYSTPGLARSRAKALGDNGLGSGLFIFACLLVLAAVVTQGLSRRPAGAEIGVALGIAAVYTLVFVRMSVPVLLAVAGTTLLGSFDECIQALLPGRVLDLRDIGFNALAAVMIVVANLLLKWVRGQTGKADRD